jgi:hypothetical protein
LRCAVPHGRAFKEFTSMYLRRYILYLLYILKYAPKGKLLQITWIMNILYKGKKKFGFTIEIDQKSVYFE